MAILETAQAHDGWYEQWSEMASKALGRDVHISNDIVATGRCGGLAVFFLDDVSGHYLCPFYDALGDETGTLAEALADPYAFLDGLLYATDWAEMDWTEYDNYVPIAESI
jgi:hypothetical protein